MIKNNYIKSIFERTNFYDVKHFIKYRNPKKTLTKQLKEEMEKKCKLAFYNKKSLKGFEIIDYNGEEYYAIFPGNFFLHSFPVIGIIEENIYEKFSYINIIDAETGEIIQGKL
ncbi:MAG: hypothetical protein ACOC3V_05215 [bacterium]